MTGSVLAEALLRLVVLGLISGAVLFLSVLFVDRPLATVLRGAVSANTLATVKAIVALTIPTASLSMLVLLHQYAASQCRARFLRNRVIVLVLSFVSAIILAQASKVVLCRYGPEQYFAAGAYGFNWFRGSAISSSFPSTYCVGAGVIAATYRLVLPFYRPTIFLLCLLALTGQMISGDAFLSDGLAGFVLGTAVFAGVKKAFGAYGASLAKSE